jgi:hypothetical protein
MSLGHFSDQHFQGLDTGAVAPCDRDVYATRTDMELIFGAENVATWANIDNLADDDEDLEDIVADRICWALAESKDYFDDRLRGGPYEIPLESPIPAQIVSMSARWAAVMLHDSRGMVDSENDRTKDQMMPHRKMVQRFLRNVLLQGHRLNKTIATSYPQVVTD